MILSTTAFYIRTYLRNLKFQEIFVFSFYWSMVEIFGLHLCEIYNMSKKITRVRKNLIYLGLLLCFRVVVSDDFFLRQ